MSNNRKSKRLNPFTSERGDNGCFKRKCGSNAHNDLEDPAGAKFLVDLRKGKKLSKENYDNLLKNSVISRNTHYICRNCLQKCECMKDHNEINNDQEDFILEGKNREK